MSLDGVLFSGRGKDFRTTEYRNMGYQKILVSTSNSIYQ